MAQDGDDSYYRKQKLSNFWGVNQSYYYGGLEGGLTHSATKLENDLTGYLSSRPGFEDAYWNGVLGYSHNDRWQLEAGYTEIPFNAGLYLNTSGIPTPFRWRYVQKAIPVRFKWRLFKIGSVKKVSGLYITGGIVYLFQNSETRLGGFGISGRRRIPNTQPTKFDSVSVENETSITGKPKIGIELGLEFVGRVSKSVQVIISLRTLYSSNPLVSNSKLVINQKLEAQSSLDLKPLSYQLGFGLRYLYGFKQLKQPEYEKD